MRLLTFQTEYTDDALAMARITREKLIKQCVCQIIDEMELSEIENLFKIQEVDLTKDMTAIQLGSRFDKRITVSTRP